MRVIFLDFDGVTHPAAHVASPLTHWCWLPVLARVLARHDDVFVVVHSTWRFQYTLDELRGLLGTVGERVIDVVPEGSRLASIEAWLSAHREQVCGYRILDDDVGAFVPLPAELIACDPERGLSDESVRQQLLSWLAEGGR